MSRKSGTVYSIAVRGHDTRFEDHLKKMSWVTRTSAARNNGTTTWEVGVSDEQAAEAQLYRHILMDEKVIVLEFSQKKYNLEDVFMDIVNGGSHEH